MKKNNLIKLAVASMSIVSISAPMTSTLMTTSSSTVLAAKTASVTMDKYQEGRSIYGDFSGQVTDIYLAKKGTVLKATVANIRNDNSYSISVNSKLAKDLAKNSDDYTIVAYGHNHTVIAETDFNNGSPLANNTISNVKYESAAGVLSGNLDSSIKNLKISVDGNKYNEEVIINNGKFSIRVSNDFYHDVKFGSHTVTIEGTNSAGDVIAQTTLALG